jgi:hypothetical protein
LEFSEVFNPNGDPQAAFMNMVTNYPNFVAEGKSVSFCRRSPSLTTCSTNAVSLVCRMVACFNLGFVCWTLGLVGWAAPWSFYFSFSVVLQSNWPSRSAPSLGYLSGDWKGFH